MLLWALLVGLSFPAVGVMSEELPPLQLTALRFAIASLALWPLTRRAADWRPTRYGMALYGLMGLCLAGFFGAMFWAAHRATALSMATLYVTVPLLTFAFGLVAGVERLAWRLALALTLGACGALGLALAEARNGGGGLQFGLGELVFFAGCLSTALYPVLSKWGLQRGWLSSSATVRTFWSLALGGVLIGLGGALLEPLASLGRMSALDIGLVVYLGLCSSAMTFWLMQRATAVLTPGAVMSYSYMVPFVSMLLLFASDPRQIDWSWLPGVLLIVAAMAVLLRDDSVEG